MAETYHDIRAEVAKLCAQFPGEYWREKDKNRAYPSEFVAALGDAGYLAALIPEEYGGAGLPISAAAAILQEIQKQGCNGGAVHAQMYIMGTVLRHGSDAQKAAYLPKIATGELRLQAFGVTEPSSGTDTLSLKTTAHHPQRRCRQPHRGAVGFPGRYEGRARRRHADHPPYRHDDEPCDDRSVL
jgi:acyl-CoA dehydrogenase